MAYQPDLAAHLELADRSMREGRFAQAEQAYAAALAQDPDQPDAWFNLAWAQRAMRAFEQALASYDQAIARGVARPEEAHLNRAAILSEHLNRHDAAEAEIGIALSINPRFVQGWLNLGSLREDVGKAEAAKEAYQQVLNIEPGNGRAHGRLAMIEAFTDDPSVAAARLKRALPITTTAEDRAEMLFALGTTLDAEGSYEDAFQAFEAANWLARSVSRLRYDAAGHERLVDNLIEAFATPAHSAPLSTEPAPVFICGMFRSGSTLAEQILSRHAAVTAGGELDLIPALVQASLQPYPESVGALSPAKLDGLRKDYLDGLASAGLTSGLVTDKRCDNFLHIGLIKALFPEAKIIHTVRQPLDNLLSIYFLHFGEGVSYGHDLGEAAHYYNQYRRLMDHWRALFPHDIFDLSYDDMVTAPQPTLERLLDFVGLDWDESCLASGSDAPVRTASAWQVRQPLFTRSSGRWQHYAQHLEAAQTLLRSAGSL